MKTNQSAIIRRAWLVLMLIVTQAISAMAVTVTGVVTDSQNEPLMGVAVTEKGNPANGSLTDLDGRYTIDVAPSATIVFTYTGFISLEEAVAGRTSIDVVLKENVEALDEVVVIGYQTIKKKDLTGSVSSVSASDIVPPLSPMWPRPCRVNSPA